MERKMLEFVLKQNSYLEGGTKEACVKVRDFLLYAKTSGAQIQSQFSCVEADEFIEAVKVLLACAFQQEDELPETWKCDSDCRRTSDVMCPGECNISKDSPNKCPYFMDEGLI